MEGINWADLFNAMDRFLLAFAGHYGAWIYATLFVIFFSETGLVFMAFLPGDSLLFVSGAVAASDVMNVWVVMIVTTAGAVLGNTVNYAIGNWFGHRIYDGTIPWIDPVALKRTHDFYERHGGKTLVLARFIPVVRSFAPLVAGAAEMSFARFQFFNVVGAAGWVVLLVGGGFLFGNVPFVKDNLGIILILGILAALGPITVAGIWHLWRGNGKTAGTPVPVRARERKPPRE